MSPIDPKQLRQNETNRRRGWILNFLYSNAPKPLEFASLIFLLDKKNFPISGRRLSADLDFLRSSKLIRVFMIGHDTALDDVAQAKLLQRYCDSEGEMDDDCGASLTSRGVNFQEGQFEESGITRVN